MRPSDQVRCAQFPCRDVVLGAAPAPSVDVDPARVSIILVSESPPADSRDGYAASGDPLFARTTVAAFQDAGAAVRSLRDILELGVYPTTAIKCPKTSYAIERDTIDACSFLLQRELALFPNARTVLLMGDTAIKAFNRLAVRAGTGRIFPSQPTYRLRAGYHEFRGMRLFPSYLQAGPAFFIETSKRRMIAEDIAAALKHAAAVASAGALV
jgi:uracil-DNA glycosylase